MAEYDELVRRLWECVSGECFNCSQFTETTNASVCSKGLIKQAADAIEELSKRIDRAIELYNRNVEKTAIYEVLMGISPEPPKEE